MNLHNKILRAINKGLNEALSRFELDDFENNELDNNIKLNKSKSTKSAVLKSSWNDENYLFIKENFINLDLPSGTLWCKYNLGASKPEEFGDYYAWGEIKPKDEYTLENYKFGHYKKLTKYNSTDKKIMLDLEDDAAYQTDNRMCIPTNELFDELIEYTDNEWTEYNGINGRIFKSKLNPDKFIFIPAAGYSNYSSFNYHNYNCNCWASLLHSAELNYAYYMNFNNIGISTSYDYCYYGFTIRPVFRK